jgi:ABC-2 type transport system permease protein
MLKILRCELLKTYRKMRTYIGFGLIIVLIPLAYWGFSFGGEDMVTHMMRGLSQNFMFSGNLFNGWFVSNMVMNVLFVHVPFLIVLVAGDIFAGESTGGTYRILMTRPPSRTGVFNIKLMSTMIYTFSLVGFLAIVSIGLGLLLFGIGDLLVMQEGMIVVLGQGDIFWRFVISYLLAGCTMCVVSALAMLFSTLVENAIGPIVGTMAVIILFFILGNLPFDFFEAMKPWLFTTYFDLWREPFNDPVDWGRILEHSAYLACFFLVFVSASWLIFRNKDILS